MRLFVVEKSSAPLSLFLLRLRDTNGNLQNILVHKMKKKMGQQKRFDAFGG